MENPNPSENDPGQRVVDVEAFRETEGTPPDVQEIIDRTSEAMSLPPGLIDGMIDEEKIAPRFPCESRLSEHRIAESIRKWG